MLFRRRQRIAELEAAESVGANFWSKKFSKEARTKVLYAFVDSTAGDWRWAEVTRALILRDEGWPHLCRANAMPHEYLEEFMFTCNDADAPMVVEAMWQALSHRVEAALTTIGRRVLHALLSGKSSTRSCVSIASAMS